MIKRWQIISLIKNSSEIHCIDLEVVVGNNLEKFIFFFQSNKNTQAFDLMNPELRGIGTYFPSGRKKQLHQNGGKDSGRASYSYSNLA